MTLRETEPSPRPGVSVSARTAPVAGWLLLLSWLWLACVAPVASAGVTVGALASSTLDSRLKGLVLIEELNCAACHKADPSLSARSRRAPRLNGIGSRVNPTHIETFLRDPQGTRPGSLMPDLLTGLAEAEKAQVARSLTHFLLSTGGDAFSMQAPDAVAAQHGRRLFHSRGCAACHSPRDEKGRELSAPASVSLGALDGKYSWKSLVAFLRQPHATRPSGRMPDMRLAGQDVERIAHFLLQDTRVPGGLAYTLYRGQVWEGLGSENVTAEKAGLVRDFSLQSLDRVHHHTGIRYEGWMRITDAGPHTFFLTLNGGSLRVDGRQVVQLDPSDRRGTRPLEGTVELDAGWHAIELTYIHTGHEPGLTFEMKGPQFVRGPIPASMLSVSREEIPVPAPFKVDVALAARGREEFGRLGCANCHDDLQVPPRPGPSLASLDAARGCLGTTPGPWPRFDLGVEQRDWIRRALPQAEHPQLDEVQRLNKTLATFNCTACHERAGLGGIPPERHALFTGSQPAMGDQGRIPPPLSGVGAKLLPEGISGALLRGQRQRPYLDASMPQFGEANVGHLVELFGKVDRLEEAPFPAKVDSEESRLAGHEMVGSGGLSCIACHVFNGQQSGEIGAVDLAGIPGRVRRNWFHLYLRQPSRFHPTVIMPAYWPDGQSVRQNVLGGDAARQIEAIWIYLKDGVRARKPEGLSRDSDVLRVGDVTELCRGQSPIGYRGIGVGYPERINLAFDAGEMALRELWKGDFVSVGPGSFHPRGTDHVTFPPGIPFHALKSLEDAWPYKGKSNHLFPQDHGYEFLGYQLDAARRPTFRYRYGDISVEDRFDDLKGPDGTPFFRRTLRFLASSMQPAFFFRSAAGRKVVARSDRSFLVDSLHVRIAGEGRGQVREGNPAEVLIPLSLPAGRSTLILEYQW